MNSPLSLLKSYGIFGFIELIYLLVKTKLIVRNARIIRTPVFIRGKSRISFGDKFTSGRFNRLEVFESCNSKRHPLCFGRNVQINDSNHISAINSITIGDNTLIASRVFISDHNHGHFDGSALEDGPDTPPAQRPLHAKPVHIGKNVWIGESVCVLPGVTIGDGAVIGAGSVVTRDIPAQCVAAGNPARVIRQWDNATHEWKRV